MRSEPNDECKTVRCLAESVAEPWLVWTDEPIELVSRVLWQYDPRNLQISVRWLDATRMRSVEGLWDEMSAALQFPHWFGRNWNALIDCLRDGEWDRRRSHVLIVTNAPSLLVDDAPDALGHFLEVMSSVAEQLSDEYQESFDQRRPATPFHAVFHAEGIAADIWGDRLASAQLSMPKMPLRNTASWS